MSIQHILCHIAHKHTTLRISTLPSYPCIKWYIAPCQQVIFLYAIFHRSVFRDSTILHMMMRYNFLNCRAASKPIILQTHIPTENFFFWKSNSKKTWTHYVYYPYLPFARFLWFFTLKMIYMFPKIFHIFKVCSNNVYFYKFNSNFPNSQH